jgi:hypothetical protein
MKDKLSKNLFGIFFVITAALFPEEHSGMQFSWIKQHLPESPMSLDFNHPIGIPLPHDDDEEAEANFLNYAAEKEFAEKPKKKKAAEA